MCLLSGVSTNLIHLPRELQIIAKLYMFMHILPFAIVPVNGRSVDRNCGAAR
jgi:hypothetical protein